MGWAERNRASNTERQDMTYDSIESLEAAPSTVDTVDTVDAVSRMNEIATASGMKTYQQLDHEVDSLQRRWEHMRNAFHTASAKVEAAGEWLKDQIESGGMETELAYELAEVLGVELTDESEIELTIKVRVTHRLGSRDNLTDASFDVSVETTPYNNEDEVEVLDWEISDYDVRS